MAIVHWFLLLAQYVHGFLKCSLTLIFSIVSNIEDLTDDKLEMELHSGRGRHPKWVFLMGDEGFRKYVVETGL